MTPHSTIKEMLCKMVYGTNDMLSLEIYMPTRRRERFNEEGKTTS